MAKLREYLLDFDKPTGAAAEEIEGFRVYVVRDGEAFSYELPSVDVALTEELTYTVDLADLIDADGTYDTYVTSYDAAGNESDPAVIEDTVIDFTAPPAPVNLRLR